MNSSNGLSQMISRCHLTIGLATLLTVIFCFLGAAPLIAVETEPQPVDLLTEKSDSATQEKPYAYNLEDRKDPFSPFIRGQATTSSVNMDEIVENSAQLTGMQLFEPGQLKLVALLKKNSQDFAMVEDVTGKGYMIHEGTQIGSRGVVKDIIPNKVVIEETAFTRAGKKIVTQIVMVLKKEGEE